MTLGVKGGERMENKQEPKNLNQRIRQGKLRQEDVVRRLGELAFGKVNDCVRLAMEETPELDGLDLSLVTEIKRSDNGRMEIKLLDRLKVLEQLGDAIGTAEDDMAQFLKALRPEEEA